MDASDNARKYGVYWERVRDANISSGVRAYLIEFLECYKNYKHGLTDLGAARLTAILEAAEEGDEPTAFALLQRWGVRG